ncbi:helix-turn-helix transcriptional regulator [Thermodesulfobacteriota bacterium]
MKNVKLKIALIEAEKSQYRLAHALGCDPSIVSRVVNGWKDPSETMKKSIAEFVGKPVEELFQG